MNYLNYNKNMEKYLELSDVMLVPDNLNSGWTNSGNLIILF